MFEPKSLREDGTEAQEEKLDLLERDKKTPTTRAVDKEGKKGSHRGNKRENNTRTIDVTGNLACL